MAIIKKLNKKSGTVYVYESISYWDKEKKQPRSKRKLIGKLDPVTGEVVPTGKQGRHPRVNSDLCSTSESRTPVPADSNTASPDLPVDIDPDSIAPAPDLSTEDIWSMYLECRRSLMETQASLAKANSTVAQLQLEKQLIQEQLEQLLKTMKH